MKACVASPHRLASEAGLDVLRTGGNALDAAIATNLVLGVVAPYLCGYGGDLFALVWDGAVHGYNGSGRAPEAATPEAMRAAAGHDGIPAFGPLPVTVPGAVEAWFALVRRFGSRSFAELASPALRLAREGFTVSERAGGSLQRSARLYAGEEEWQRVYGGARPVLRQPDLARTIGTLAREGPDAYYRGEIAEAIAAHLRARGGLLATADLAEHAGGWVEPLSASYRGVEVLELPPNTQGVTALEALAIIDGFEPARGADREHVAIEACKLALADRDAHVTDQDHMALDARALLSAEWVAERRARIDPARAGAPEPGRALAGGTAYMCAADERGMLVSLIQSNWAGFGSGVTVPGWGINLHNRGHLFSLDPAHANVVAPRKRTMHTLIPAMAFRDGRPWLVFGTMGGHGQPQTHVQLLARLVDDGADVGDAIDAPRWVVSPGDWSVAIEDRFPAAVVEGLRARGHDLRVVEAYTPAMGHAHAIRVEPDGCTAAADPRSEGAALGL